MADDWVTFAKFKVWKNKLRDAWFIASNKITLPGKCAAILATQTLRQYMSLASETAICELGHTWKKQHPNWASYKCDYFATIDHNQKTTHLGDWLSILDFLAAEEEHISFYMSAKASETFSNRGTNIHLGWYNFQVLTLAEKDNFIYKILFYMELLPTWDDSSTAKLLQEKFPPADDTMFRAVIHTLISSEKVYFSSNGSSNYKSLPPPPTPAPSLALPTPAVAPPTPAVGRALPTAATPDNSTTRSGASIRYLPDDAGEAVRKKPREMRTTYGLLQALKDFDFKTYVGNKKYHTMECLVQTFHYFQEPQSWKVFIRRNYSKKVYDLLQDLGLFDLTPKPDEAEEWKKLLGDLTNLCGSDEFSVVAKACDERYDDYPIQWKHIRHINSDKGLRKRLVIDVFHDGDETSNEASNNAGVVSGSSKTFLSTCSQKNFKVVGKSIKGEEESKFKYILGIASNMAKGVIGGRVIQKIQCLTIFATIRMLLTWLDAPSSWFEYCGQLASSMTLSRPALIFQKSLTVAHSKMNLADALNIAGFAYCTCDAGHNSKVGKIMVIKLHYVDVEGMVVHITLSCTTINTETGKGIAELIEKVVDELFAVAGVERKVYIIGQCTDSASAVLKGLRAHMWNEPIYLVNNCAMHALSTIFSYPYLKAYADVCDISVMSPVSFLKNLSWLFQNWASENTIKQILLAMDLPAAKLMQVTSSAIMLTRWFTVNNALVQICEDEAVWGMLMKFCEALADGATGTVKDVGTRIFKWMSSDVFKTQCYFLSAFCETFHTPYTAAVQASDEFVEKNETVRMIGGYRMRLMPRIYASMICEAEYLFETRETIGDDMKEGCPWARYRKLYNTLDDSLKRRIN